jgi:MEMO1 family protein
MEANLDVRPSPIAGRWYPNEAGNLAGSVDQYLEEAALPEIPGEVVAVMAPHAGHMYSGAVAGYAFAALRGSNPEVVAVISPMHYPTRHALLTSAHAAYETPLGALIVDQPALDAVDGELQAELGFGLSRVAHDSEHSLEIELPFLQRALAGEFRLLPVMVRDQTIAVARALGKALAKALTGRRGVLVASTDLSHFYPAGRAKTLDEAMLHAVVALDPLEVMRVEEEGRGFACGRSALAAVLWAALELGADRAQILRHRSSGDVTGDYSSVVGYAAAVITRPVN